MRVKLKWVNYVGQISKIEFVNSVALEEISRGEYERLYGLGIPIEEITIEEAERIIALSSEDYIGEENKKREFEEVKLEERKKLEEENLASERGKVIQDKNEGLNELKQLRNQHNEADLKAYLESIPEKARKIYPQLIDARDNLIMSIEKNKPKKQIDKAKEKLKEIQLKFVEAESAGRQA